MKHFQLVPNKMVTASHDTTVKVWNIEDVKEDATNFGEDDEDKEKEEKKKKKKAEKERKEKEKREKKEREKNKKNNKVENIEMTDQTSLPEKNDFEQSEKQGETDSTGSEKKDSEKDYNTDQEIDQISKDMGY